MIEKKKLTVIVADFDLNEKGAFGFHPQSYIFKLVQLSPVGTISNLLHHI